MFSTKIKSVQLLLISPATSKLESTAAIPPIKPAPTKAGINGMKIFEIDFKIRFTGVCFCLAFWAAFTWAALASTISLSVILLVSITVSGKGSPSFTPTSRTISSATLLTVPGPTITCKVSSSTTPITPSICFNPAMLTKLGSLMVMRTRVIQWISLATLPGPPTLA